MISEADLYVYQGDDFSARITLLDGVTGDPVDLSGYGARVQFRLSHAQWGAQVIIEPTCGISLPNYVDMYISAADTEQLWCTYKWGLHLIAPNGVVTTVLRGSVFVINDVTREPVATRHRASV
jgi:hypothetical protein